jgi:2,4'-dihydroxyacetophenone dioxygenase
MFNLGKIADQTRNGASPELMRHFRTEDERRWVPLIDGAHFYPFCFDITHSAWHIILRCQPGLRMAAHYHTSRVLVSTLRGKWKYVERDWVHEPGSYLLESPGDVHSFMTVSDVPVELFTMNEGANLSLDAAGNVIGYTDVLVRLDQARRHYKAQGFPADEIDQLVR